MNDYSSPLKTVHAAKYDDKPRDDLIELIKDNPRRALEIGCGTGATGWAIKQKFLNTEYIGVELDQKAAQIAKKRLDKVIIGNIEKIDIESSGIQKEYFDLIICADVLEHLYDPWKALFDLRSCLAPGGIMLASIPNVQNIRLILYLIEGHWTYKDCGIQDATHIRFFSLKEIMKMFTGSGYEVIDFKPILMYKLEDGAWPRDIELGRVALKNVTKDEALTLFAGQYLLTATKS